jgi:ribonuclease P/MRP protein subunit RPP40
MKKLPIRFFDFTKSFIYFDCKLLNLIYKTFIRPLLEFATPVWSPYLKSVCEEIEWVQRRVAKLVHSTSNLSYEDCLKNLGFTTLAERRQRGDMIQLYKIMHEVEELDKGNNFQIIQNQVRGHCFKYFKEITRLQPRENYFFNRSVNLWNYLPNELVTAPSVNSFRAGFDCWISNNQSNRLS